jgi:3-hydroxyisobutyrate dehydrogenase-like beta-hydroxyacid dehydrogenase
MAIGMIGIGEMGGGFVDRLLLANYDVVGWNRTKGKAEPYIAKGMRWADSPRAVTEQCDCVLTMVTNDAALDAVAEGPDGILAAIRGKVLVEMSTIAVPAVQTMAKKTHAAGGVLLDAPVLGSQVSIVQGKLLIMVGGDEAAYERVKPYLQAIGPRVFRVGDVGQAKTMKIALNLNLATQMLALSEGLLLAVRSGIDRDTALEIMLNGAMGSPMLQYRAPLIKAMPEKAWFDCDMMQKDMNLALALGAKLGIPLPTTAASNEWLNAARGQGLGHHDFSVLYYALARAAGFDGPVPMEAPKPEPAGVAT